MPHRGVGINWKASSQRAPLAASLSVSPTNPASADCLVQDIFMNTNSQTQITTTNREMMLCNVYVFPNTLQRV